MIFSCKQCVDALSRLDPCDDNPVRMMTGVEEIEPPYEGKKEEDVWFNGILALNVLSCGSSSGLKVMTRTHVLMQLVYQLV